METSWCLVTEHSSIAHPLQDVLLVLFVVHEQVDLPTGAGRISVDLHVTPNIVCSSKAHYWSNYRQGARRKAPAPLKAHLPAVWVVQECGLADMQRSGGVDWGEHHLVPDDNLGVEPGQTRQNKRVHQLSHK